MSPSNLNAVAATQAQSFVWDTDTLDWVAATTTGGGGGGTVDQGTGGASAWLVTGPLTNTQLRAADVPVSISGAVPVTGTFWQATQPVSLTTLPSLVAGSALIGKVGIDQTTPGTTNRVDIGTDGSVTANPTFPASATVTSVSASASSVTLKASNAARRGLAVYNDSSVVLYLKCGATASTSSFTVAMAANSYYEVPQPCYTGVVDGIWASATGAARVTEIT